MPVANSDIVVYGSALMPEDEVAVNIGGAIDLTTRIVFTPLDATGSIEVVGTAAGDNTQNLTVTARDAQGVLFTDVKQLNGTGVVAITGTFERILKAELDGAHTGTVTLRKAGAAGDLMVFEPGVNTIRRPFHAVVADAAGGANRTFYEKVFIRNNHATLALTAAVVKLTADPTSDIAFALETTLDGVTTNGGGNNRQVAPGGFTFNTADKNVANSQNLSPVSAQGVWLEFSPEAGDPAFKGAFTITTEGTTV